MELSLDLSLASVPKTISQFLADVSCNRESFQKLAMLDNFVQRLEEEMKKVDAFKRELPLCMLLVKDAITKLKEEKIRCMGVQEQDPPPVTEELFIPLKTNSGEIGNGQKETCDKKNWMSSVQLWSPETKLRNGEDDRSVPENPIQFREQKNNIGGALIAFNGNSRVIEAVSKEVSKVPSFSLMAKASEFGHSNSMSGCGDSRQNQPQPPTHMQQNSRKQRRCWSPELHRRFVNALEQLGGAQVATPKQIRELMKVEGLTNDEVKSHLQKYRLHVRSGDNNKSKGNSSSQSGSSPQGPLTPLLLGWSAPEQNSADAEEEEHSDGRNWKDGAHHQPDNHSL